MITIDAENFRRVYFLYTPTVLFGSFFDQVQSDPNFHYGVLFENQILTSSKTQMLVFDNMTDWNTWADYGDVSSSEKQRIDDLFNL
jgi:hypothetical protein